MPGQRLADRVGAKRLQIVHGDHRAGFGAAVAVADRNAEIVEELQRRRLGECAADEQRAQLAAECLMNCPQKRAAEFQIRAARA